MLLYSNDHWFNLSNHLPDQVVTRVTASSEVAAGGPAAQVPLHHAAQSEES